MPPRPEDSGQTTMTSETSFDEPRQPVTIGCLFNDAALYRKALAETSDGEEHISPPPVHNPALQSVQDFAELVGDDLQPLEQDMVGRFAQLAVENWDIAEGDREEGAVLTEEPVTLTDDERKKLTESFQELGLSEPSSKEPTIPAEGTQLSPEYVLALLIEEFGNLAPEGEEKLILEADGAVIQDVAILVCLQLARERTHRELAAGRYSYYDSPDRLQCFASRVRPDSAFRGGD